MIDKTIFKELIAYNGFLKDLISNFQQTSLSLSSIRLEKKLIPFNSKNKNSLIESYADVRYNAIDELNQLRELCEQLSSLGKNFNRNKLEALPVSFSIYECQEIIQGWIFHYEQEVLIYNYSGKIDYTKHNYLLEHTGVFISNCHSEILQRLLHISKIINSYIENFSFETSPRITEKENVKDVWGKSQSNDSANKPTLSVSYTKKEILTKLGLLNDKAKNCDFRLWDKCVKNKYEIRENTRQSFQIRLDTLPVELTKNFKPI